MSDSIHSVHERVHSVLPEKVQPVEISQAQKKSQHNKKYYDSHKPACYRKSLIYDIKKSGRIPKKEIMQRYGLPLDEFIKLFGQWVNNKPLTQDKKEALSQLVVQYFDLKENISAT
ncbi:hypothetical protein OAO87_00615 [bacterium]|nr:hypothetical protein [bacterium]